MVRGVHARSQTAFRLPEGLLARLKTQADREGDGVTMTAIVERALERELDRCEGITTSVTTAPVFLAAVDEQPEPARKNCKHRNMRMTKGVCPDCHQSVGYSKQGD